MGTVKEDQEQTDKQEIIAALSDEGQTSEEIARAIGKPPGTTRTRLDSLYREGLVGRKGAGKKGNPYKWIRIDSAQDSPLSAETNNGEANEDKEGDQCQTLEL